MPDHLGLVSEATHIVRVIEATAGASVLTPDLGNLFADGRWICDRYFENVFCHLSRHRCTLNRPGASWHPDAENTAAGVNPQFKIDAV